MISFLLLTMAVCGCMSQSLIDPIPRPCRTLGRPSDLELDPARSHNEYPAGGVLMALASIPAGLDGVFEFYLCPQSDNSAEECLERIPLELGDGSGSVFNLTSVTRPDKYEIAIRIPDDVTCDLCTLQLRVVVNCRDPSKCVRVDDVFCSDVTVREAKDSEKRMFALLFQVLGGIIKSIRRV
ncbi:uncharacterized protein [Cherax quadricarinatus]|nr:uncharacterized protein LOC128699119 isoform X1 [Cherax quadricarinatus]